MSKKKKAKRLEKLFAAWIEALRATHAASTLETWENYITAHYLPWFEDADGFTVKLCAGYCRERLTKVQAASVKKERTALRSFLEWALLAGEIDTPDWAEERPTDPNLLEQWAGEVVNSLVPKLPKRARGTPYHQRRRVGSFEVSPEQVRAFIRALPEWSQSSRVERFPVRARFILAYATSLRPSTLDRLVVPKHYALGSDRLRLTADTDKARYGREVPLTKKARRVLDYVIRVHGHGFEGLIFGHHDFRTHVTAAAHKAMPPELAAKFAGSHLRSAAITHRLEKGANLLGVQQLAGHRQLSTTSRYAKPSFRAAQEALTEAS